MTHAPDDDEDGRAHGLAFELNASLPVPLSVEQRGDCMIVQVRDGTVVDAAFVQVLNDLLRCPPPEQGSP